MAIIRVGGKMLQDNLERDSDLAVEGNLLYIDVNNSRVGIRTSSPSHDFTVVGTTNLDGVLVNNNSINASGNITGGNLITGGDISAVTVTATGNVEGGNLTTAGDVTTTTVTATGNISGGNLTTTGTVSAPTAIVSSLTDGRIVFATTNGELTDDAGLTTTGTTLTATGNVEGGNLVTAGDVDAATGTITDLDGDTATFTGNVEGGNLVTNGDVTTTTVTASGNVSGGNLTTAGDVTAATGTITDLDGDTATFTGNVSGGNISTAGDVDSTGNITGGNLNTSGTIEAGNITVSGSTILSDANLTLATSNNGNIEFDINGNGIASFNSTSSMTLPTGNTAARPASPDTGSLRFNSETSTLEYYDGEDWSDVSESSTITSQIIIPDGSSSEYSLDQSTTEDSILVQLNGVGQYPGNAYSVAGNTITFSETPTTNDLVEIRFFGVPFRPTDGRLLYSTDQSASTIDITKAIAVLDGPDTVYTLPDGLDGQLLYCTPGSGNTANVQVTVQNFCSASGTTSANTVINAFGGTNDWQETGVLTCLFYSGSWRISKQN